MRYYNLPDFIRKLNIARLEKNANWAIDQARYEDIYEVLTFVGDLDRSGLIL